MNILQSRLPQSNLKFRSKISFHWLIRNVIKQYAIEQHSKYIEQDLKLKPKQFEGISGKSYIYM